MTLPARRRPALPRRFGAFAPPALGAVAAVALCACAVATAPAAPSPASKPIGSTGVPLTTGKQPAQPAPLALPPHQRAMADASAILASFVVPTGARRLPAAPTVERGVLETPDELPQTPDAVDKAGWWIAPGAPQSVLAWEARHLPHRFSTTSGTATGSGPGFRLWSPHPGPRRRHR